MGLVTCRGGTLLGQGRALYMYTRGRIRLFHDYIFSCERTLTLHDLLGREDKKYLQKLKSLREYKGGAPTRLGQCAHGRASHPGRAGACLLSSLLPTLEEEKERERECRIVQLYLAVSMNRGSISKSVLKMRETYNCGSI